MSLKQQKISPVQQEYFQRPPKRVYKECNRYEIADITLYNFGLKIDQGKRWSLPKVWSNDSMNITAPKETIKEAVDKPFCCTHCGSENYIKYGKNNGKQVYKCKDCNKKFVDNLFFEKLKANPKIICLTLDLYFKGVSLRKISDHLKQFHDLEIAHTTLFYWIAKYIRIIDEYTRQFKPQLGELWNVDEMMISVNGNWFYLWNVIDDETRFHLASVISKERKTNDARKVLITAKKRSHGNRPKYIITDGLKSYIKAVDDEFHTARRDTIHVGNVGIRGKDFKKDIFDNNLVERLQRTIRERYKTQRGLKDEYSAFIRGHQLYYNFIRPHESLNGKTPSELAGITIEGKDKWLTLMKTSLAYQKYKKNTS
jgi:transposase-like protein